MKILEDSGNYQKNKKLVLVIICLITVVILFLSSVPNLSFYIDAGDYESPRSLLMVFPIILGMIGGNNTKTSNWV